MYKLGSFSKQLILEAEKKNTLYSDKTLVKTVVWGDLGDRQGVIEIRASGEEAGRNQSGGIG